MLNIVLPMAGRGSRFSNVGYKLPKPLITVNGKPMIDIVINNIAPKQEYRFIFLVLQEHLDKYNLEEHLRAAAPNCVIVPVNQVTEGAACTVLLAKKYINSKDPMMIANCDQWVDIDINLYLSKFEQTGCDGLIMTMKADSPKWSYIEYDTNRNIIGVLEKQVVSDEATVGIYNFSHGSDFVSAAEQMINENIRVNNEFYVAPVYNILLRKTYQIDIYNIGTVESGMYGLGTPEDLELFLKQPVLKKATNF